jgi:hypothetical protein
VLNINIGNPGNTNNANDAQNTPAQQGRASWYAQGASDSIGDRLLMFDNSGGPSLELLRFSPKLVTFPGFENALRERVELLSQFRHASFAKVRAVEKLEPKNDLTLVSNGVAGKRLSDGLLALRGPAFAMWLIRELVPALVSLQQQGRDVAHGALTTDRIVLTPEGRLIIVEHVLGSALDRLHLSRAEMWARFGIGTVPAAGSKATLDGQSDVFQLGLVALSVLLGRSLAPYEYPDRLGELIDRFEKLTGQELPSSLRSWLSRALQITGQPFESARDAQNGLGELESAPVAAQLNEGLFAAATRSIDRAERALRPAPEEPEAGPAASRVLQTFQDVEEPARAPILEGRVSRTWADKGRTWQREPVAADLLDDHRLDLTQRYPRRRMGLLAWVLAGFGLLAVAQGGYITYLLYSPAPSIVVQTPQPLSISPAAPSMPEIAVPRPTNTQAAAPEQPVKPSDPVAAVAAPSRSGGFRLVSQIEVQLLEGDRVLGSSADGAIVTTAGRHEVELVNNSLGYRAKRVIDVKSGEVTSVPLARPEGRLSINAVPWADVWIDGIHIGETPLANLAVAIGPHEVAFRHPAFTEQRLKTVVRFDVPTRLSADLR